MGVTANCADVVPALPSGTSTPSILMTGKASSSVIVRVVVLCAVAGVLAFEAWFFFFAGSSLPNG